MRRRLGLSRDLLRESDDALRTILGFLDDVAPVPSDGVASALDLHLALGVLEDLYAVETASGEASDADPGRFRRAVQAVTRLGDRREGLGD